MNDAHFPAKSHFSGTYWKILLFAGNPSLWKTNCSFLLTEQVLIPEGEYCVPAKPAQMQVQKHRKGIGEEDKDSKTKTIFGCKSVWLCLGSESQPHGGVRSNISSFKNIFWPFWAQSHQPVLILWAFSISPPSQELLTDTQFTRFSGRGCKKHTWTDWPHGERQRWLMPSARTSVNNVQNCEYCRLIGRSFRYRHHTGTNKPMTTNEVIFSPGAISLLSSSICIPICSSLSSFLPSL